MLTLKDLGYLVGELVRHSCGALGAGQPWAEEVPAVDTVLSPVEDPALVLDPTGWVARANAGGAVAAGTRRCRNLVRGKVHRFSVRVCWEKVRSAGKAQSVTGLELPDGTFQVTIKATRCGSRI
ncbi:MAG: hypothetical protein ACPLPR_09330 [Bacillota bacterium]